MNIRGAIGAIALCAIFFFIATDSSAQTDASAKSILDKVSSTYREFKTIQADFTITATQPQQPASNYSESGVILMETAAGKYRIKMDTQELISDGKSLWTILNDVNEVQVTEVDNSAAAISPVTIFSFYTQGYKYLSVPDEHAGNTSLHVVELSPEDTRSPYYKIKLRINKTTNLIHDVTIFDKNSVRYTYSIRNTKANPAITANRFTFQQNAYPGMEIVDLR